MLTRATTRFMHVVMGFSSDHPRDGEMKFTLDEEHRVNSPHAD